MNQNLLQALDGKTAPCYLYSKSVMQRQFETLRKVFAGGEILYSVKCNPFPPLVAFLTGLGAGADAASPREVLLARESGAPAENIFFSAPGRTKEDFAEALPHCTVIADSLHELDLLETVAAEWGQTLEVGLRINPAFGMSGPAAASKFGVNEEQLQQLGQWRSQFPHLTLAGIHVHLRSQVLDADTLVRYYENVYSLAERLHTGLGAPIKFINFGGGVGFPYDEAIDTPLNFEALARGFSALIAHNRGSLKARLLIESGRFLVGQGGSYVTPIVDIKQSHGRNYYVVQNGLNGFLRPALAALVQPLLTESPFTAEPLYTSDHAFQFTVLHDNEAQETVDIVGNLCTAADVLAKEVLVNKGRIGDLLAVSNAGSYARTLSPLLFSSHTPPAEYLVD